VSTLRAVASVPIGLLPRMLATPAVAVTMREVNAGRLVAHRLEMAGVSLDHKVDRAVCGAPVRHLFTPGEGDRPKWLPWAKFRIKGTAWTRCPACDVWRPSR
jgi:hypothetical protein